MVLERISRDEMLLEVAFSVAKRGTCTRAQVGAVISRDGRIISTGYNGAPAGVNHCDHTQEAEPLKWSIPDKDDPTIWEAKPGRIMVVPEPEITTSGCLIAGHAEENAIAYAAQFGVALGGSELHVTHAPCYACARMIINAGITKVVYTIPYRKTEGLELLTSGGIWVMLLENDA